ncbi:protein kinase family protein [Actinacidiphila soli]|uniref:protein kinase family protein n=1 Tax=Actinacidiphila soli TaxID=2487275 RepID=UPI000FCCB1DE|nr:protein kinase family protein [Actinacidiphila soli]
MAERSTAAVGVANESGDTQPLSAQADSATADDATDRGEKNDAPQQNIPEETAELPESKPEKSAQSTEPPELHSGHKLAGRYRLEECLTRVDGFSSWRAVDEKLRRAVGIHILPADHSRARPVLAAARSAALLGDPRFVQVLDAVEENDLVYVIHEWLPDATDLTAILAAGPQEAHDCYQMASQVAQAMAAAHREGLAHLRLSPDCVLRTESGQYRIRGLAVAAALHGVSSERPQREDTEAIGALLYASLTQRWPYPEDQYGLTGLPKDIGLVAPDQVRARVHRGLSEVAMRALVNDGATASRELQPCATPEELAKAIAALPKIRPPEASRPPGSPYQRTTYQQGAYRQPPARQIPPGAPPTAPLAAGPPPALPGGRTGKALKWAVSSLLIAALGLGSWQLADTLMNRQNDTNGGTPSASESTGSTSGTDGSGGSGKTKLKTLPIQEAAEYYPFGGPQHTADVGKTYDGATSTYWRTYSFKEGPKLAPYKDGVGIVYDLGSKQKVSTASIDFEYGGDHTTVELYAADSLSSTAPLSGLSKLATTSTSGKTATLSAKGSVSTRYVVVWLTALPYSPADQYSGAGYKQAITNVVFKG